MNEIYDIICVGDVVTDAFIRLFDDQAQIIEKDDKRLLAMEFGTKIPFDHVEVIEAVGNSANAAVSMGKLGLRTGFVTNVGGDAHGRDMIAALHHNGVNTSLVRINHDKKSNYHYVLWYKSERTILIRHEDYDYQWPHLRPSETPKWLYLSSVSQHGINYHDQISDYLDNNPDIRLAFQPGTFQMEAGTERLARIYQRSEVLILNREEAVKVGGGNHEDVHDLLNKLHALGPKIVVVTDGPNGAYASDGTKRLQMPLYPDPAPPKDRTGAGDAFASTFIAALAKGLALEEALKWAPINSMNVVQRVGAQAGLVSEYQLDSYLKHAPEWYHPKEF